MQTVSIQTAQNVDIEYEIANIGERIGAAMIDYLILISYVFIIVLVFVIFSKALKPGAIAYFIILLIPAFCYDLVCEIMMDGQSFGKKVLGIKVVKLDGTQPSIGSYLLRWVLRIVDMSFFSGSVAVLTILINGKGQRLGDIAAGTTVIRLKQSVGINDTILVGLDEGYQPSFKQSKMLSDSTIRIVKEALDFDMKNRNAESARAIMERAKSALAEAMGVSSDMEPRTFLETIIKDYNYYHGKE